MTTSGWTGHGGRSTTPRGRSLVQAFALVMLAAYLSTKLPERPLSLLSLSRRRPAHNQAAASESENRKQPEKEDSDVGWHAPLLPEEEFRDLLPDQKYNRSVSKLWFGSMTAEEVSDLREQAAAAGLRYHFVLSTGHSGTTTLSKAETYQQLGFDTSSCFWVSCKRSQRAS